MKHKVYLIVLVVFFITSLGFAQGNTSVNVVAEMDGMLTKLFENNLFVGSVLVAQNGNVLLNKGYGLADRQQNIPNSPQTIFRLQNITRQFTSMGILILQTQGNLEVSDLACQHLPECPEGWQAFSIHDLLTNIVEERFFDQYAAYSMLGKIIANVSGQSYENFMRTMIFYPLKMHHTGFIPHQANEAIGYYSDTSDEPARYEDTTDVHADAGLYSSVEDLYLWDQALYTEQLIPKELLEIAFKAHIKLTDNVWAHSYGYGWGIGQQDTHKVIGHGGNISGFDTRIFRYPDDKVTIIVLSNQENVPTQYIASLLSKKVFGKE
jgi:CubicO group peptidase (beta-lactamase class C family)